MRKTALRSRDSRALVPGDGNRILQVRQRRTRSQGVLRLTARPAERSQVSSYTGVVITDWCLDELNCSRLPNKQPKAASSEPCRLLHDRPPITHRGRGRAKWLTVEGRRPGKLIG